MDRGFANLFLNLCFGLGLFGSRYGSLVLVRGLDSEYVFSPRKLSVGVESVGGRVLVLETFLALESLRGVGLLYGRYLEPGIPLTRS